MKKPVGAGGRLVEILVGRFSEENMALQVDNMLVLEEIIANNNLQVRTIKEAPTPPPKKKQTHVPVGQSL